MIEHLRNGRLPIKQVFEYLIALVIRMDSFLLKAGGDYFALSFVLLKDKTFYNPNRGKRVKVIDVLNYKVPYHFLK